MAVAVGQRHVADTPANRSLIACDKARELAYHTVMLCKNRNIFLPEYQSSLTDDIIRTAKDIYIFAWCANNVYVKTAEDWRERKAMQKRAVMLCSSLLALIGLAKAVFHLRHRKVEFWAAKAVDARAKADECYRSWKAHASKGNTFLLMRRMDEFYRNLWREKA